MSFLFQFGLPFGQFGGGTAFFLPRGYRLFVCGFGQRQADFGRFVRSTLSVLQGAVDIPTAKQQADHRQRGKGFPIFQLNHCGKTPSVRPRGGWPSPAPRARALYPIRQTHCRPPDNGVRSTGGLSGSTSNWAGNGSTGHTHELAKATATLAGVVKLVDNLTAGGRDAALSAEQGKILKKDIEGKVAQAAPSGQIAFFAGSSAPAGWLKANGAAVSRALYAALFAAIGTTYGAGDGSTTFNLPDLRGEFMRGWDDGRGIDRGRAFGSAQGDAIRNITGEAKFGYDGDTVYDHNAAASTSAIYYPNRKVQDTVNNMSLFSNAANNWRPLVFDASRAVPTADENRPRNIALLACIKI